MANADFTRIATNIGALNALNSLRNVNNKLGMHQQRLATGQRINSAADDPAGLTIATKLNTRSEGLKQALSNIGDAKSLLSVAESGLSRINDIMVQMRNKAEAAASDTLGQDERDAVVTQLKEFAAQIDDIVEQTEWNDTKLIDGSFNSSSLTFQTGADKGDTTTLSGLKNMKASDTSNGLNIGSSSTISSSSVSGLNSASSASDFASYMDDISTAMDTVSSQLSKVGSLSARLTFKEDQIAVAQVNVESSYNRIMNADMAFEQLEATKFSILQQTATTMLAQANQAPQGVLALFR